MSNTPDDYKNLIGKLFIDTQYYKLPWQEEHGKIVKYDSNGYAYEENNIITKTYRHLVIIDDIEQRKKHVMYRYNCRYLYFNVESNGNYSHDAWQAMQVNCWGYESFDKDGIYRPFCKSIKHYIEDSSKYNGIYSNNDEAYVKWYEENVIGSLIGGIENYPWIDYAAYTRYNALKTRQLVSMIQPLAQYSNMKLAG